MRSLLQFSRSHARGLRLWLLAILLCIGTGVIGVAATASRGAGQQAPGQASSTAAVTSVTSPIIDTVAGGGVGDGGPAIKAGLCRPTRVAVNAAGDFYIADFCNHRVRKLVASSGIITTVAGNGIGLYNLESYYSGDGGPATKVGLTYPENVASDAAGNIYVSAQTPGYSVVKVDPSGTIRIVAGTRTDGFSGDGGPATSAELNAMGGLALDSAGNLYIADSFNARVRKVDRAGIITTYAGNGIVEPYSGEGGPATSASLYPLGLSVDRNDDLLIADGANHRIRSSFCLTLAQLNAGDFRIHNVHQARA